MLLAFCGGCYLGWWAKDNDYPRELRNKALAWWNKQRGK